MEDNNVPYIAYEGTMARFERIIKRLVVVIILLAILWGIGHPVLSVLQEIPSLNTQRSIPHSPSTHGFINCRAYMIRIGSIGAVHLLSE